MCPTANRVCLSLSVSVSLPPPGVVSLSQALCSSDDYSNSLIHLDLSRNPGVLSGDDATVRHPQSRTHTGAHRRTHTLGALYAHVTHELTQIHTLTL